MSETASPSPKPVLSPEAPRVRVDVDNVSRVGKTRVTLDTILAAFERGESPEEIARGRRAA